MRKKGRQHAHLGEVGNLGDKAPLVVGQREIGYASPLELQASNFQARVFALPETFVSLQVTVYLDGDLHAQIPAINV